LLEEKPEESWMDGGGEGSLNEASTLSLSLRTGEAVESAFPHMEAI